MNSMVRILIEALVYAGCGFALGVAAATPDVKEAGIPALPPVCTCYCPAPMPAEGPHVP